MPFFTPLLRGFPIACHGDRTTRGRGLTSNREALSHFLGVGDARLRDEKGTILRGQVRDVHDGGLSFQRLVFLEPLRLELEPEAAPVDPL